MRIPVVLVLIIIFCLPCCLFGQVRDTFIHIRNIQVEGNRKTRTRTLLRELTFHAGDSIVASKLASTLETNRLRLMNLSLFNRSSVQIRNTDSANVVDIAFVVDEAWYIYPVPTFQLADRNFNVWWEEQRRSLDRVNYGISTTILNFTGRKDPIRLNFQLGYTPSFSVGYQLPFFNRSQTLGLSLGADYGRNREISYQTDSNKLRFAKLADGFIQQQWSADATLLYRPKLFVTHALILSRRQVRVNDTIAQLNPEFMLNGRTEQDFTSLTYSFTYDGRDVKPYPRKGIFFDLNITRNGLLPNEPVNDLMVDTRIGKYFKLYSWLSTETILRGRINALRTRRPYNLNRGLGFGSDFIRGYEYYVSDGMDYAYIKNSVHLQLFNRDLKVFNHIPFVKKVFSNIPLELHLSFNTDLGFSNDLFYNSRRNNLAAAPLFGVGLGLDIIAYYDIVWQLEYTYNALGERNFFLHYKFGFQ